MLALLVHDVHNDADDGVHRHLALVIGHQSLFGSVELETLALVALAELGDVIETEYHVLRGHGHGVTVGGAEDVVRLKHEHLCLDHRLVAQRQVNSHLVTVEVGVESRASERVELDGLTLDELGLECLDTESVQRRCTVEQHGMSLHHVLEDVPNDGFLAVHDLLGALDRLDDTALDELADHEGLVQLGCHVLGDTALTHLELGTDHDH